MNHFTFFGSFIFLYLLLVASPVVAQLEEFSVSVESYHNVLLLTKATQNQLNTRLGFEVSRAFNKALSRPKGKRVFWDVGVSSFGKTRLELNKDDFIYRKVIARIGTYPKALTDKLQVDFEQNFTMLKAGVSFYIIPFSDNPFYANNYPEKLLKWFTVKGSLGLMYGVSHQIFGNNPPYQYNITFKAIDDIVDVFPNYVVSPDAFGTINVKGRFNFINNIGVELQFRPLERADIYFGFKTNLMMPIGHFNVNEVSASQFFQLEPDFSTALSSFWYPMINFSTALILKFD